MPLTLPLFPGISCVLFILGGVNLSLIQCLPDGTKAAESVLSGMEMPTRDGLRRALTSRQASVCRRPNHEYSVWPRDSFPPPSDGLIDPFGYIRARYFRLSDSMQVQSVETPAAHSAGALPSLA